jgi:hypothetical protein
MLERSKRNKGELEALFINNSNRKSYVVRDKKGIFDAKGNLIRILKKDEKPKPGEQAKLIITASQINKGEQDFGDAVLTDTNNNGKLDKGDQFFKAVDILKFDISSDNKARQVIGPPESIAFQNLYNNVIGAKRTGYLKRDEFVKLMTGTKDPSTVKIYDDKTRKPLDF